MEIELTEFNEKHRRLTSLTPHNYLSYPIALAIHDTETTTTSHSIDPLCTTSLFVVAAYSSSVTVIDNKRRQLALSPSTARLTEIGSRPINTPYSAIHAICISARLVYVVDMNSSELSAFSLEGDFVATFYRDKPKSYFITDIAISPAGETAYLTDHFHNLIRVSSSYAPHSTTAGGGVLVNPDRISTTAAGAVVALCRNGLYLFNETRDGLVFIRQLYQAGEYGLSGEIEVYTWACFCCDPKQELIYLVTPNNMLTINLDGYVLDTLHLEKVSQYFAYNVDVKINNSGRLFFLNSYHNSIVTY